MSNYNKYGISTAIKLTQLDETIVQLKKIKFPTRLINELTKNLEWVRKDFDSTIELLNKQARNKTEIYNKKNLQLHIEFY